MFAQCDEPQTVHPSRPYWRRSTSTPCVPWSALRLRGPDQPRVAVVVMDGFQVFDAGVDCGAPVIGEPAEHAHSVREHDPDGDATRPADAGLVFEAVEPEHARLLRLAVCQFSSFKRGTASSAAPRYFPSLALPCPTKPDPALPR